MIASLLSSGTFFEPQASMKNRTTAASKLISFDNLIIIEFCRALASKFGVVLWSASFVTALRQLMIGSANEFKETFHVSLGKDTITEHNPLHNISLSSIAMMWLEYGNFHASAHCRHG